MSIGYTDKRHYADIAAAIRAKGGGSGVFTPAQMAGAILALPSPAPEALSVTENGVYESETGYSPVTVAVPTGTDTSDATARAGDILAGKTAYVASGKATGTMPEVEQATPEVALDAATGLVTATARQSAGHVAAGSKSGTLQLPTKAAETITPGTEARVIAAGQYLTGAQTVAGDAALVAGNIRSGVSIFGVTGSYGAGLCTVSAEASPAGAGSVTGAGYAQVGMTVTLTAEAGTGYVFLRWEVNGETVGTGASYSFTVSEDVTVTAVFLDVSVNYLTFLSPSAFTLKTYNSAKNWDGTLEYSTDGSAWTTWSGTTTLSSADGKLYLRGTGNTYLTTGNGNNAQNARWVLTGSDIGCYGNIGNLLDHVTVAAGEAPAMGFWCCAYLFYGCTALVTPPSFPATTLEQSCCSYMFQGCTGLTRLPALPTRTLAYYCYHRMFYGCTGVKLSRTETDEYQYAYRIPTSGTGTANSSMGEMFTGTGGTFTGTPTINTTYYTTAEPV